MFSQPWLYPGKQSDSGSEYFAYGFLKLKFKVRARTRAGYGPFSNSIELNTTPASEYGQDGVKIANPNTDEFTTGFYGEQSNDKTAQIAGAAAGGAVIVIMLIVFLVICTK